MKPTCANLPLKLAAVAGFILTILICIKWVDRPAALWAHEHIHNRAVFVAITYLIYLIMAFVCLRMTGYGVEAIFFGRKSFRFGTAFGGCLSVVAAFTVCEALKIVFGRTGVETFEGRPGWLSDGIYGFFPFHAGLGQASFPSGHTTIVCAFTGILWQRLPKLRILWLVLMVAVMVSLYAANWHWVSDIIAGLALGLSCAKTTGSLLGWDKISEQDK